jgi:spoIIIJ-associated protein
MATAGPEHEVVVRGLLEAVVEGMQLDGTVTVRSEGDTVHGTVEGEDLGIFIGRHGQTIDAVQHLAYRAVNRSISREVPAIRVVIDAEGYRERRAEALRREADDAADDAVRFGRPVALPPMVASERKLVHEFLRERGDVATHSEGEEPERHLVVEPA